MQNSIRWAYVAMWGAFALAGMQGGEAVAQMITAGSIVVPITAVVYAAFAVGVDRRIEAARKGIAHSTSRGKAPNPQMQPTGREGPVLRVGATLLEAEQGKR
jgi:hypothetical protein